MDLIEQCQERLIDAIRNSEEYVRFQEISRQLKETPECMERLNTFRKQNFQLQAFEPEDALFDQSEQFELEWESIYKDPVLDAYLEAEVAVCRLIRKVTGRITGAIDLDLDFLDDVM